MTGALEQLIVEDINATINVEYVLEYLANATAQVSTLKSVFKIIIFYLNNFEYREVAWVMVLAATKMVSKSRVMSRSLDKATPMRLSCSRRCNRVLTEST